MSDWFQHDWCVLFVLVLSHFLWQGTSIAIFTAIAMRAVGSAVVRYRLWLSALLMMAICPVLTLGWLMQPVSSACGFGTSLIVSPEIAPGSVVPSEGPDGETADAAANLPVVPTEPVFAVSTAEGTPVVAQSGWQRIAPILAGFYFCGVALMWLRLIIGLWSGSRLRGRATAVTDTSLLNALQRQAAALGLKLRPDLAYCEHVAVPTVMGIFRPMILLPFALASGLSPDQIESVLAHELAHLRRYDHLVNLLQRVIESLLFFHPAVWFVSHRIREEREHCCDDLVVASGTIPLEYATSLLRVAELGRAAERQRSCAQRQPHTAVSLFATGDRPSSLRQRIARLVGESAAPSLRLSPRMLITSAAALLAGLATLIRLGISSDQLPTATAGDENNPMYPRIEFRIAVTEADRNEEGVAWLPIMEPRIPAPAGKSGANLPIEERLGDQWRGLLWETNEHAMLSDGTWRVVNCEVVPVLAANAPKPLFSIQFTLDAAGGAALQRLTKAHLHQSLAIVVDGTIISAPTIHDEIRELGVIGGNFTREQAEKLVAVIRAGGRKNEAATVVGTVVSPDAQPVAGIEVLAFKGGKQLEQKFTTNERGEFRVPKAWRETDEWLTVVARDGRERLGWCDFMIHGHSDSGQKSDDGSFRLVLLPMSRTIRGRLLDDTGQPLTGIPLQVTQLEHEVNLTSVHWRYQTFGDESLVLGAVSDSDGRFRLKLPADTFAVLEATDPDWVEQQIRVPKVSSEIDIREYPPDYRPLAGEQMIRVPNFVRAARVIGRVIDARTGKPLVGVEIGAEGINFEPGAMGTGDNATTDTDGQYVIGGLASGRFHIQLLDGAEAILTAPAFNSVKLRSGEAYSADFSLSVGRRLAGRVVDMDTAEPIPGCRVTCTGPARPGSAALITETGPQGEFEFYVPAGRNNVDATEGRRFGAESIREVDVPAEGDIEPIVLKVGEETESVPGSFRIFAGEPLERKVSLHLDRTPLFEVLTKACESAGLKLNLDVEALKSRGYTRNMAITIDVDRVSLREALTQILQRYEDLSYMLDGDEILVSTRKHIEAKE